MKTAEEYVVELGHLIDRLPIEQRVQYYRALARTTASQAIAEHFFACADDLSATEDRIGQRTLNFGKTKSQ